jgi:hypothetical protein
MKRLLVLILVLTMSIAVSGIAVAGVWSSRCTGCHKDGNAVNAPTKDVLLAKYKTAEDFVKNAMASKSPMMKAMQKEDVLKEAAKDLYK